MVMMNPVYGPRRSWRMVGPSVVAVLLWLAACAMAPSPEGQPKEASVAAEDPSPPLPAGAIPVGENLYQVPIGPDADGCMMYRPHAPDGFVVQAIYYRAADGSFTPDKRRAACRSE